MIISSKTASEIAFQLSETIGQKINIMDTSGIIIASSDPSRIGKLHEGAKKVIDEKLPLLIVEDDNTFKGTKQGINLPIVFEGESVGIIGITGPVDEVLQYGQIIKRMTEILLLDNKTNERKIIEQKARDRFLDEWIIGSFECKDPTGFERMAESFSIDPNQPMRIAVLSFYADSKLSDAALTEISGKIRHALATKSNGKAFRTATHMVCILRADTNEPTDKIITDILSDVSATYRCGFYIGLDDGPASYHLNENYRKAVKALEIAKKRNVTLEQYTAFNLDYLLDSVSDENRKAFIKELFPNSSDEEMRDYLKFAALYLECDGSLIAMSDKLFVHKNTIKYKISKLTEVTGTDIRTCHGAYVFTLAVNLFT